LVELLVVIGVIAVLIGILMPALSRARQSANKATCLANLRQMGQTMAMYTNANKGRLPFGYWDGTQGGGNGSGAADWAVLLLQVLRGGGNTYTTQALSGKTRTMFTDTDTLDTNLAPDQILHYSAHPRLMPSMYSDPQTGKLAVPYKVASIRRSSEVILIMDGAQVQNQSYRCMATAYKIDGEQYYKGPTYLLFNSTSAKNETSINAGVNTDAKTFNQAPPSADGQIRFRHMKNTMANFLFVDGHSESRAYKSATQTDVLQKNVNTDGYRF
jgi:prepilin-type processing-associated H-X9-DG protein